MKINIIRSETFTSDLLMKESQDVLNKTLEDYEENDILSVELKEHNGLSYFLIYTR